MHPVPMSPRSVGGTGSGMKAKGQSLARLAVKAELVFTSFPKHRTA